LWYVWIFPLGALIKFGPLDAIWLWLTPTKHQIYIEFYRHKTEQPFHPPANSAKAQPPNGWLWYVWLIWWGVLIKFGSLVGLVAMAHQPPHQPKFFQKFTAKNEAAVPSSGQIQPNPATQTSTVVLQLSNLKGLVLYCPGHELLMMSCNGIIV
jgi:hypothetical protein